MFRQPHLHIDDDAWRREIAYVDVIINSLFDWSIQFHEFKTIDEVLEWLTPIVFKGLNEDVLKNGLQEKDYREFKVEMGQVLFLVETGEAFSRRRKPLARRDRG